MTTQTIAPPGPARMRRLDRWRLIHTVRLYGYGAAALVLAALALVAAVTGQWATAGVAGVAVTLSSALGTETVRVSVLTPAQVVLAARRRAES